MASKSESALAALVAAFTTQANGPGGIPVPSRNESLPTRFAPFDGGAVNVFFNVNDGDGRVMDTALGDPDDVADVYHIEHHAEIEWVVEAIDGTSAALNARDDAFDDGLIAIDDAIKAASGGFDPRTLGGAVDWCQIDATKRSNLVTDALPNVKGVLVSVRLEFVSARPF